MKTTIRLTLFRLLTAAILAWPALMLFQNDFGCNPPELPKPTTIPMVFEAERKQLHTEVSGQTAYYQKQNDSLQHALSQTKTQLRKAQQSALLARTELQSILASPELDSSCSELRMQSLAFVEATVLKDSFQQNQTQHLEQMILLKDSQVLFLSASFHQMDSLAARSIHAQHLLTSQVNDLSLRLEKQKRKNRWIGIGALVLSGTITSLYLAK